MNIAIQVPHISPRLSYVVDWIFNQQLGISYQLCTEDCPPSSFPLIIRYGSGQGACTIPNTGLLFENNIEQQEINLGVWDNIPTLFATEEKGFTIPFDLFSAIFFLISRYEEYLPYTADKHRRFPAQQSILYKQQLLERPIVDEWIAALAKLLSSYGIAVTKKNFSFIPSYDIDIAWSYKNKGLKRNWGAYCRDLLRLNFPQILERTKVLLGHERDPYDSYEWMHRLHQAHGLKPLYFILAAAQNSAFDKHILPQNREMQQLIKSLADQYQLGIHPSYNGDRNPMLFAQEKSLLEKIIARPITQSRQHYIKLNIPQTYRQLLSIGILQDYSMGYSTHLGFRAGTSHPFYWYDISSEEKTNLEVVPFCFMDTTAHYDLDLSAEESFERLKQLRQSLKSVGGLLITVFHNFSLGSAKEWNNWAESYMHFVEEN